ncbi:MAG: helix-turn-helix transcriptional regulator [Rhizobiaceae bacterium]
MVQKLKQPNPIDIHVGGRLRLRRTMEGLSQEKLGKQLGITFQQIQKYEKGTNRMGASRLQEISEILKTPISYFFEDAPSAGMEQGETSGSGFSELAGSDYVVDFLSSSEGLQLNRAFIKIKDIKVRRKIIDLVKVLAKDED